MKTKRVFRTLIILAILSTNIGCDQVSKNIARHALNYNEQIGLLNNHLILTKVENTGAFLSMGTSLPQPLKLLLLTILPVIALILGLVYLITNRKLPKLFLVGICFAMGGGIGNMYDRVVHGSVTDFIHIDFILFRTGVFNMADVSLMTGVFLLLLHAYLDSRKTIGDHHPG